MLHVSRSSLHNQFLKDYTNIEKLLESLAISHPVEGFWKCYHRLRNSGEVTNHKRSHRVYKQLGLVLRRKVKKRLLARVKEPLEQPVHFTHSWSIDFVSDALSNGVKFRSFPVIDDYNREVLFIETDYSLKSNRVLWVWRHLVGRYGEPQQIRMDNGPEFVAKLAGQRSGTNDTAFKYTEPGKPRQNAYIERFNKTYREGILDAYFFDDLEEVVETTAQWLEVLQHYPAT